MSAAIRLAPFVCATIAVVLVTIPLAAQDLETLLERHEKAMGGARRLAAVDTVRVRGEYREGDAILGRRFELEKQGADRMRFRLLSHSQPELCLFEVVVAGQAGYQGVPGSSIDPMEIDPTQAARSLRQADLVGGALLRVASVGEVELLGRAVDVEGGDYLLRVIFANGDAGIFYLDSSTYTVRQIRETWIIHNQPVEIRRVYEGYRSVAGVRVPTSLTEMNAEGSREFLFKEYELNPKIDEITCARSGDL